MKQTSEIGATHRVNPWRLLGWGAAGFILLLPLIFRAPWTASDYVVMGVLLGSVGLGLELAFRASRNAAYRVGAALAVVTAFLLVWVNGAVGMIGSEDNPLNLMFAGVLAIALFGALRGRFRSAGMALAMLAAALTQFVAGLAGLSTDMRGGMLAALFAGLWLLSAALFRKAAADAAEGRG